MSVVVGSKSSFEEVRTPRPTPTILTTRISGDTSPISITRTPSGTTQITVAVDHLKSNSADFTNAINEEAKRRSEVDEETTPQCRICFGDASKEDLISPCLCSGTLRSVHQTCLEKWLGSRQSDRCELCNLTYITQREPKKFIEWLRDPGPETRRNMVADSSVFVFVSTMTGASTALCLSEALPYFRAGEMLPSAIGLVTLSFMLLVVYVAWVIVVFRDHYLTWRKWRKVNNRVRILITNIDKSKVKGKKCIYQTTIV